MAKHQMTPGALWTAMDHAQQLDESQRGGVPTGAMVQYPWPAVPAGWLRCNGMALDPAQYPELAALCGGTLPHDPTAIIKL